MLQTNHINTYCVVQLTGFPIVKTSLLPNKLLLTLELKCHWPRWCRIILVHFRLLWVRTGKYNAPPGWSFVRNINWIIMDDLVTLSHWVKWECKTLYIISNLTVKTNGTEPSRNTQWWNTQQKNMLHNSLMGNSIWLFSYLKRQYVFL